MHNNDDNDDASEFELKSEIVSDVFRKHPHNPFEALEKAGFIHMDDETEDETDIVEERAARPMNAAQQALVEYFGGISVPDEDVLALWHQEANADEPNYPLWRRYFRDGNPKLKTLLLYCLERHPTDRDLLNQLSFLHEFLPMLKELIALYLRACDTEQDAERFKTLAQDFDNNTNVSGYEALMALGNRYPADSFKTECVRQLLTENAVVGEEVVKL